MTVFQYRNLSVHDGDVIMNLRREASGGIFTSHADAYFRWKYLDAPAGPAIGLVAEAGRETAGVYSVIPIRMLVQGDEVKGAISFDTMTLPKYRRQGLFVNLATRLYERLRKEGFELVYGFPNKNSIHGFLNNLGWSRVNIYTTGLIPTSVNRQIIAGGLKRLFIYLTTKPVSIAFTSLFRMLAFPLHELRIVPLYEYDDRLHDVWVGSDKSQWPICLVRDGNFLKWRFFNNPKYSYQTFLALTKINEPVGYVIFKIEPLGPIKMARLMDFNSISKYRARMRAFILRAYLELHDAGQADSMMVYLSHQHKSAMELFGSEPFRSFFEATKNKFLKTSNLSLCYKQLDETVWDNHRMDLATLWHLTPADMDWF